MRIVLLSNHEALLLKLTSIYATHILALNGGIRTFGTTDQKLLGILDRFY